MTTKPLDLTKPMRCRDGTEVVIYCTDAPGSRPVHGRLAASNIPTCWPLDGRLDQRTEKPYDLVNVPNPLEVWLNIYDAGGYRFAVANKTYGDALKDADMARSEYLRCIGRKRVVIENPEGFDNE